MKHDVHESMVMIQDAFDVWLVYKNHEIKISFTVWLELTKWVIFALITKMGGVHNYANFNEKSCVLLI